LKRFILAAEALHITVKEETAMEKLVFADPFQKPIPARFKTTEEEDRYYRSHEPRSGASRLSVATAMAFIGFLVLTLNLLPG
jgi:hypothetical protein